MILSVGVVGLAALDLTGRAPHNCRTPSLAPSDAVEYGAFIHMTFDEQLQQAFETLTDRLRNDVDREVRRVIDDLAASAQAERERIESDARDSSGRASQELASAIATARQQGHDDGREAGKEEGRRRGIEEGYQQAEQEARALEEAGAAIAAAQPAGGTVDAAASARLAAAVRSIGRGRSLSEILDTLVTCAGREATRAGVWLVRGGGFRSWRVIGFGDAFDHEQGGQSAELSFDEAGVIAEAARTNDAASGDGPSAPAFAALPPGRKAVAVPLAMSGQVVAVLYADQGNVAELGTTSPEPGTPNPEPFVVWPDTVEVLTRYAARCLEALTAFKAARALTERPGESNLHPSVSGGEANPDEEASARRYARLLVSEIKLYHESAVVEGRRDRDLATRLGGEIAHARVLYEQRVPPDVRQRADYFHDELVRTLADGDATMLELKA